MFSSRATDRDDRQILINFECLNPPIDDTRTYIVYNSKDQRGFQSPFLVEVGGEG